MLHFLKLDSCSAIIALCQDYRKSLRNNFNKKLYQIGFIIYKTDSEKQILQRTKLDADHLVKLDDFEKSGPFVDYREVTKRVELATGYYIIIPCTFLPNQISKFILRIYSEIELEIV